MNLISPWQRRADLNNVYGQLKTEHDWIRLFRDKPCHHALLLRLLGAHMLDVLVCICVEYLWAPDSFFFNFDDAIDELEVDLDLVLNAARVDRERIVMVSIFLDLFMFASAETTDWSRRLCKRHVRNECGHYSLRLDR